VYKRQISRKAMDIDSLGEGKIDMLYEAGILNDPADLYALSFDQLNGLKKSITNSETGEVREVSLREKSAQKILDGVEASKLIPFDRVLYALGIRFVGSTVAKKLAQALGTMDALMETSLESLIAVDEIGEKIAQSVVTYFNNPSNQNIINRLKEAGLQMQQQAPETRASNILEGKKIVVSGVFTTYSRNELKKEIENHGGQNVGSISAKTSFILAGENMGPAKLEKAEKLGVPIVSEEEFIRMING